MIELHTPEPWKTDAKNGFPDYIESAEGDLIARCPSDCADDIDGAANARRIVACVNACAGYATEELEQATLDKRHRHEIIADLVKSNKQRDQLLAALEAVNESAVCFAKNEYSINADAISKVEDAIASVKANTQ